VNIKRLIWIYFWFLLFEGALRKWLLPGLDTALLLVRDPIVLLIYLQAAQRGIFPKNAFIIIGIVLAFFMVIFGVLANTALAVNLYGVRVSFLHVPLIFVMARALDHEDVVRIGKFVLYTSVPMAMLIVYQFRSPQDAWINKGAFNTHYFTVRPSATFPFVTGTAIYLALVSVFVAYGFLEKNRYPLWLRAAALPALLGALAVSGSRMAITAVAIVVVAAVAATVVRGRGYGGIIGAAAAVGLALVVLGKTDFYKDGQDQLTQRFEDASVGDPNQTAFVTQRVSGDFGIAMRIMQEAPLFGHGSGAGTSVGMQLNGNRVPLGSHGMPEGEWGRLIWESGPVLGVIVILYRLGLALNIAFSAYKSLLKGIFLPILLVGGCIANVAQGQWGVTNIQGFACFVAGLALAACRPRKPSQKSVQPKPDLLHPIAS
jgi:hypothetical protein